MSVAFDSDRRLGRQVPPAVLKGEVMLGISRREFVVVAGAAVIAGRAGAADQPAAGVRAIDEGMFVDINGSAQWITVRGGDRRNPVLLWLHGGPGIAMSGQAPLFFEWERDFTIVQWDQPGGGATYAKNGPDGVGELSIERFTRDAIAVAEWSCRHLGCRKLVVMGTSWGTLLGLQLASRRPDLVAAYVGAAQFVSGPHGSKLGYEVALKSARERKDAEAIAELERAGPPPYQRFEDYLVRQKYVNPPFQQPSAVEARAMAEVGKLLAAPAPPGAHYVAAGLPSYDALQAFMDTQRMMFSQTAAFDAASLGFEFKVPMFFFQGADDLNTPAQLVQEYYERISAPAKKLVILPETGHFVVASHHRLLELLKQHVRPLALSSAPG